MTKKRKAGDTYKDSDAEMAKLLQEKRKFEAKRDELALELFKTEYKIIEIQSRYGAIYNQNISALNLPNEVTCLIFGYALVLSASMPEPDDPEAKLPPLVEIVVSHVCRHWRSVALSYPRLWASFRYDVMRSPSVPLERFDAYLERSGSMGLELWFGFKGTLDEPKDLLALLQKAVPHLARWKRFTLISDLETPVLQVLKNIEEESASAPMLEHFAFCPNMGDKIQGLFSSIDILDETAFRKGAPNLKSVLVDLTGAITCFPPLANVTTLRIEDPDRYISVRFSWPVFRDILALPSLANLSIVGEVFHPSIDFNGIQPVMMNNMKNLRIADNIFLVLLLPSIRAPLLESLTIKDTLFSEDFATSPHGSSTLIANPYIFPSLTSLCFINVAAYLLPSTRHFAKMTAKATDITFSSGEYDESFWAVLNTRSSQAKEKEKLWPKLKTLTFNLDPEEQLDDIFRFAKGRPKKSVTLRLFEGMDESWKTMDLTGDVTYAQLARAYRIETMNPRRNWLRQVRWPPASGGEYDGDGGLFVDEEDPFSIDEYDDDFD